MKKIIYLLIAILGATNSFAQSKPLQFNEEKYTFGKVKQGVPVTYAFAFKNVSDKPVVIENASASCGCTTPEYPKGAISKGGTGQIKVTYNAQAPGAFTKQVTVKLANVNDPIVLNIEGEVVDAASAANAQSPTRTTAVGKAKATPTKTKAKVKS
jgi:hypothetical protein